MGHDSSAWMSKVRTAVRYVRTHKGQLLTVCVVAVGLLSRFVPAFPSAEVLSVVRALLGE